MANHSTSNLQGLNHWLFEEKTLSQRRFHRSSPEPVIPNKCNRHELQRETTTNQSVGKKKSSQLLYENLCLHAGNASSARGLICTNQALRLWFSRFHAVLICTNQALRLWFLRLELQSGWCWSHSNQWMLKILRFLFISVQLIKFDFFSFHSYSGTISHFLEQCLRTSCLNAAAIL